MSEVQGRSGFVWSRGRRRLRGSALTDPVSYGRCVPECPCWPVSKGKARGLLCLGHCEYSAIMKLLCLTLLTGISAHGLSVACVQ